MAGQLRFDDKVVLVTGAGGGLGKEYALEFAKRGAKVVVNDLGGSMSGEGPGSRAADKVVQEIQARGGIACANYDSVEDGEKVVQTALDNYGKIDIVINNAGILRDRSFARTSDLDWDLIHRVHLRGSFMVSRAAWPHMKNNKFGRIIMTTSAAGIYGNFGQANYSAAKLGMLGLANTLAIEGRKYNIACNTIAPVAGSRLTATVMPDDILNALKAEYVVPLVVFLCHDATDTSGELFEVGGGWIAKLRWQRTKGAFLRGKGIDFTAESVRDAWDKVTDFSEPSYPTAVAESTSHMYQLLLESGVIDDDVKPNPASATIRHNPTSGKIDPDKAIGQSMKGNDFSYTERDVILYALGTGVSTRQDDYLKFLFEMNEDFCTLPSFIALCFPAFGMFSADIGLAIDPTQILHGEEYCELYRPLPTEGNFTSQCRIVDVLDKGSGAVIIVDVEIFDESGEKIGRNQVSTFVQRAGGFGGKRASDRAIPPISPPKRTPDASMSEQTSVDQAALYRLSGDRNPLHIDPSFAAMGGFSQPILHGLCTFGHAVRHVLATYADNDVTRFKAVKVRFTKTVLPGQTIRTDMWQEGNRIFFQSTVAETGAVCLSGCYMDLHPPSVSVNPTAALNVGGSKCEADVLMKVLAGRISSQPNLTQQANAIFQFNILLNKKPCSQWVVDMKSKPGKVYEGESKTGKPDVTVTVEDNDFIELASGKQQGPQAFLRGKLKVKGNLMLVQKLGTMFMDKISAKL